MIATLREIFMISSALARAFNRVAGNILHFKYCSIKIFIIKIIVIIINALSSRLLYLYRSFYSLSVS